MKIADLLALHPSLITGGEPLARLPNPSLATATPANRQYQSGQTQSGQNGWADNVEQHPTHQSRTRQVGQTRPRQRHLLHHHSKAPKKPHFCPSYIRQWDSTSHTQRPAKNPQNGANTGANNTHPPSNQKGEPLARLPNPSLATAPPANRQYQSSQTKKANLARLPDPYNFYSRYLTIKGGGVWRLAICPFHDDTRPSLSLNMQHGGYICHTCGAKGDRIAFYMHRFNVDFVQACKALGLYD